VKYILYCDINFFMTHGTKKMMWTFIIWHMLVIHYTLLVI